MKLFYFLSRGPTYPVLEHPLQLKKTYVEHKQLRCCKKYVLATTGSAMTIRHGFVIFSVTRRLEKYVVKLKSYVDRMRCMLYYVPKAK